jgi:hypothetical protein
MAQGLSIFHAAHALPLNNTEGLTVPGRTIMNDSSRFGILIKFVL